MKRLLVIIAAAAIMPFMAIAQDGKTTGAGTPEIVRTADLDWEYWKMPEKYLKDQGAVLLSLVDQALVANPPEKGATVERQLALCALDAVIHDTVNDDSPALHAFIDTRIGRLVDNLGKKMPRKAIRVYKVYNDGFIVRSRKRGVRANIAYDLCGTRKGMKVIPDSLMRIIVDNCDALFLSHNHPDHSDRNVISMFLEAGKPVYATADNWPENEKVSHIRKEGQVLDTLLAIGPSQLKVAAIPGHQNALENNIWAITLPSGKTVAQCGDQSSEKDLEWIFDANFPRKTDVLIINGWAMEIEKMIRHFNPGTVISGHEDELGHTIDHREAFWLTRHKFDSMDLPMPASILAWGEWIDIK